MFAVGFRRCVVTFDCVRCFDGLMRNSCCSDVSPSYLMCTFQVVGLLLSYSRFVTETWFKELDAQLCSASGWLVPSCLI